MTSTHALALPQGAPPELITAIEDAARNRLDHLGLAAFAMPRRAAVAHEAGHAIVGAHEGIPVRRVTVFSRSAFGVELWGGCCTEAGAGWTTGPDTTADDDLGRARFIIAGLAAEAITRTDTPASSIDELTLSQFVGLNAAVKLDDDPDRSDAAYAAYAEQLWHERVWGEAIAILDANREPFLQLVKWLERKGSMQGARLRRVLGQVRRIEP
jgi:hypothetical protein